MEASGGIVLVAAAAVALLALLILVVGLEIKRELVIGELRDRRAAALPAVGGVALPA